MINDVELRRGNWVITKTAYDTPAEIQVHAISEEGINGADKGIKLAAIPFEDLEGIELTREHLLAWGFQIPAWAKDPNIFEWTREPKFFETGTLEVTGELLPDGFRLLDYENLKPQMYVHQMQNLMLDLCGEALLYSPH